jgi:large subunit ribosomal protein L23
MKSPYDIVLRPVLTEQSYDNVQDRKYTFIVAKTSNKTEIKHAVEQIFSVEVEKVNTLTRKGKKKRMGKYQGYRPNTKRAIVKITENSKTIEFFEGMA